MRQCSASTAEELFQDVWMRIIGASDNYTVEARFATYLYRIAHNRLIDHFRSSSRRPELTLLPDDDDLGDWSDDALPRPESAAADRELAHHLATCLEELPEEQREAFLLREEAGLGVEEIASATEVGRETAKSRLRYAVKRLRQCLEAVR